MNPRHLHIADSTIFRGTMGEYFAASAAMLTDAAWRQKEAHEDDCEEGTDEGREEDEEEARRVFFEECDHIRRGDTP